MPEGLDARALRARAAATRRRSKVLTTMTPADGRRRGEEGEHPRPRRRRLPDGREVELHEAPPDEARLPRHQRRRGRARARFKDRTLMEQNPHSRASRAASSAATASARTSRTSTCATSCTSRRSASGAPSTRRKAKGYLGKNAVRQRLPGRGRTSTPAPARTSAARRRRSSTRSRASAASRGSSRRSPRRPAPSAARPR